jgi:phosphatidylserine/phosphatidylglycerophosphate/cardiolipin synthase-like enzyme
VTISNPRWVIDGQEVTSFVYGRTALMVIDVQDFAGGLITFKLQKDTPALPLMTALSVVPPAGSTPITVTQPVTLNYQWQVLEKLPTTLSQFNVCCDAGTTVPYQTNAWFLQNQITDDLLYPPLHFTAAEPGQAAVTSPVIRREMPQFVPGNKIDLYVNGDQIQTAVLDAINAATHHIHLDWFFFDTTSKIADALAQAASARNVQVRLLFDVPATAMPEPLGQGVSAGDFSTGLHQLRTAGVKVATSGMQVPPLDNPVTVTDPEYRDRFEIQKQYTKNIALTHGGIIALRTLQNLESAYVFKSIPRFISDEYKDIHDFGSAGIGTPVLLGGCRDHTKLVIVDGKIALCGGANAQHYYIYDNPIDPTRDATDEANDPATTEKWTKWHDSFVRYEGPAVRGAQRYFTERWAVSTGEYLDRASTSYFPNTPAAGSVSIKVISNVPGLERDIAAEYLRLFRNSTQRIQILNPYITDDLIATFIAQAAQVRKLPVELIVPQKYLDFSIARDLMKARWDQLRAAGVTLYAYDNHMLHVKVATADGTTSIVASYNFAKSSAAQLFEHGIVVQDADFAAQVAQKLFDVDRAVSTPVTTSAAPDWSTVKNGPMRFLDRIV